MVLLRPQRIHSPINASASRCTLLEAVVELAANGSSVGSSVKLPVAVETRKGVNKGRVALAADDAVESVRRTSFQLSARCRVVLPWCRRRSSLDNCRLAVSASPGRVAVGRVAYRWRVASTTPAVETLRSRVRCAEPSRTSPALSANRRRVRLGLGRSSPRYPRS